MKKIEKLKEELNQLQEKEFMLQMVDHWSSEDYAYSRELSLAIKSKKKEIEELGGEK